MVKYNDHPLYCFLSPEEKKLLQPIVKSQSFMAHETIINLGERNRDIICLEEGSVSIQVEDFEGNVREVTRIHSGNLVGEMNFIIPTRRTANVVALTFGEADIIPFAKLCSLLKEYPLLAEKIFSALSLQLKDKYLGMINA
ncbi:MAG TPA: cyclic nucleotide-binding domain-containing protein [Candidatus Cloacimonas sp.]|jgi:CRP-like cAMP-binding protein|nr:cyclic nucleotide-binding domain-containing protein [Candidatus Cloacimonas sp.]HPX09556.1 cyclic nucleotide-binding domain-containing protein [Candidatus Cloacimonas sp.]HQC31253.1 cyclic nucleotide-binding domain-containing protein [Candidatus Cloacimonas sp.]